MYTFTTISINKFPINFYTDNTSYIIKHNTNKDTQCQHNNLQIKRKSSHIRILDIKSKEIK